jgi:hypothetical protein
MKPIHAIVQLPTTKGGRQPTPDVSVQYTPSPRPWIRRIPNAHSSESDTAPHHDIDNSDHQIIMLTIGIRMRNQEPAANAQRPAANFSPPGLMTADYPTRNREARGCLEALPCFPKARSCFGNAGQVPSGPASSVFFFVDGGVPCGNWELFLGFSGEVSLLHVVNIARYLLQVLMSVRRLSWAAMLCSRVCVRCVGA